MVINEQTIADRIASLTWPQKRSLSQIARDLSREFRRRVSRQYVHQIVNKLGLPYIPGGIREQSVCKTKGCDSKPFGTNRYCDDCIEKVAWIPRTGTQYRCACGCGRRVYRNRSRFRHGRNKRVYYNRECYLTHHSQGNNEHSVLSE